ncbi:elongator complex protein 3 [Caldanaerobacter sp.]|uniref:elongator complex protein 3 n=1 Tax=Caldanaerobacter sp. TaxID=2930036 RepID=UPI003C75C2EB
MKRKMYIIPIFIPHWGCPFKCVFCNQNAITGQRKDVTIEEVVEIIETHLKTIPDGANIEVSFFGGSFTGIPIEKQNLYLSIAREYLLKGKIQGIRLSTRPDYISEEILENLKAHDVSVIELGVQSMEDDVLQKSRRGHTSEDVVKAVSLIRKYGFKLGLQLMIGLPGDTEEKSLNTARKIVNLRPDFVRIYPTIVLKNTHLERMYREGKYTPLSLEEAIKIAKKMYIIFAKEDIDVIRIGLQTTENINFNKDVVAGPFHPAIGQLVESAVMLEVLKKVLDRETIKGKKLTIFCNGRKLSTIIGQKRYNKKFLEENYGVEMRVKILERLDEDKIVFSYDKKLYPISIPEFIKENF